MNQTNKIKLTLLGMGLGLGMMALSAEGAASTSGAYGILKRLFLKGGEAAADEGARQVINMGALHEEYELTTTGFTYWDLFWGKYRVDPLPSRYRLMWLDPLTYRQSFETYTNGVLDNRHPFYYEMHNRQYYCRSSTDPLLAYEYNIHAGAGYLAKDRVIKSEPGHEVLYHPATYTFGLRTLPRDCVSTAPPFSYEEKGTITMPRNSDAGLKATGKNVDVQYLIAIYAPR
jgi:hypothetical protein